MINLFIATVAVLLTAASLGWLFVWMLHGESKGWHGLYRSWAAEAIRQMDRVCTLENDLLLMRADRDVETAAADAAEGKLAAIAAVLKGEPGDTGADSEGGEA